MTTKPNPAKKAGPGAKAGAAAGKSAPAKVKASADSVRAMKPAQAAASGRRPAPPAAKPAAAPTAAPASSGASGRGPRASRRASKRGDMELPSNLSEKIAGLDKIVEREKQREKIQAAMASGQSIKTTDRDARENRKVLIAVLLVVFLLVGGVAALVVRGLLAGPTPEELASLNGWAAQEMDQALRMITTTQVRAAAGNAVPTDDAQKRRIIQKLLNEKFTLLQTKTEKEIQDVVDSASNKSQETLLHNRRALELLQTGKDAYGQPWQINSPAPKSDDQIVSYYIPFVPPPPPPLAVAPPPPPPGGDTTITPPSPDLTESKAWKRHNGTTLEDDPAYEAFQAKQRELQEKAALGGLHKPSGGTPPPANKEPAPAPAPANH